MKKVILSSTILILFLFISYVSFSQVNRVGFMIPVLSGDFDEVGIGGVGEFKVIDKGTISPQLLFYFPNHANILEFNANFNYYFYSAEVLEFYGLAGLNFTRYSWHNARGNDGRNTELGLNLGAGLNFEIQDKFAPFTELRATIGDYEQFVLAFGMKFNLR